MRKVYLGAYINNNLGDDIFVKMISERYKNVKFYTFQKNNCKYHFKNVILYNGIIWRIINKILEKLTHGKRTINHFLAQKHKTGIVIGGSMFIEGKSGNKEELLLTDNAYIIGSNFGPYQNESYIKKFEDLFKKCKSVSFRDRYSYNLFSYIGKNISYAPDIVLGLNTEKININTEKRVIISIIDCKNKIDEVYEKLYDEKIIDLTKKFLNDGYKITYMSFCENEGDEIAIKRILNKMPIDAKKQISQYYYKNNIEEALNILANSSIIVGSRFHANILGLVFNKTIIPIIYSNKTKNFLEDINFKGLIIDIRALDKFDLNKINDKMFNYKLDITNLKKESENHFNELDKLLKYEEEG